MSNVEQAFEDFISQGFTAAQSAGIVGNLITESGINPEAVQQGGPGRGIAQWSVGGRWVPSLMTGNPTIDLQAQENYIMQELQSNPAYGLAALKGADSPTQAAEIFGTDYERYGIAGNRLQEAQTVYNQALAGNWPTASSNVPDATDPQAIQTSGGGGGDLWGSIVQNIIPGFGLSPIAPALDSTGKLVEELGTLIGFGAKKEPQNLQSNDFLHSMDELLNPSVSLLNPFGIISMALARGGIAIFGAFLLLGGIALIAFGTKTGRSVIGIGGKVAAFL